MKMYKVSGVIQCGHRLYTIAMLIHATNKAQAIAYYKANRPNARYIKATYKYDVESSFSGIYRDNLLEKI